MNSAIDAIFFDPVVSALHSGLWLLVILILVSVTAAMLWKARHESSDSSYVWAAYSTFPVVIAIYLYFAQHVVFWQGALALVYLAAVAFTHLGSGSRRQHRY